MIPIHRTISLAAILMASSAFGQTLYSPVRAAKDQGITLKSWGSGTIAETDEAAFEGANSIRVSSRNFFQGGIVTFAKPLDLSQAFADKNQMLQFALKLPSADKEMAMSGGGAVAGPSGSGKSSGGGAAAPETGGSGKGSASKSTASRSLGTIRIVLTTSDGLRSEGYLDVKGKVADQRGWVKAGIPLQAITGFGRTNKTVQSVALATDAVATVYLGEATVLSDSTPVYAEMNHGDLNLALGDEVTFAASGTAGASPLKYTWDFNAEDGLQVDAEGPVVKRKFRKPGKYVVTLTAVDQYGLKAPYSTKINVEVNP